MLPADGWNCPCPIRDLPSHLIRCRCCSNHCGGVSNKSDMERSSLGLGLFIVIQIAEAHGGAIRAESIDGRTTFTMTLPKG